MRPESPFTNENSQWLWRFTEYCWPTDHLASPHITNEPSYVADSTPDEIARRSAPRASEHPGKRDEGNGKIRCCDGEQAEERDGRRGMSAGPEVDGHVGERGGEEGEVEEWG